MNAVLKAYAVSTLRGLLPYPDWRRRRQVRRAARRVITVRRWPDDANVTGPVLAQLALQRLLWLQEQTRRATFTRQREASALLSRSALEVCIVGMYALNVPDAKDRLEETNRKTLVQVLGFLDRGEVFPKQLILDFAKTFGDLRALNVRDLARQVDQQVGADVASELYERLYPATSTFFVHGSVASLLRHVKRNGKLRDRPGMPWALRSPAHLADACVGLLAIDIARSSGADTTPFGQYALDHADRVLLPMPMMVFKGVGSRPKVLVQLVQMVQEAIRLRRYLESSQAVVDGPAIQEQRARDLIGGLVDVFLDDSGVPKTAFDPLIDHIVGLIAQSRTASHVGIVKGATSS